MLINPARYIPEGFVSLMSGEPINQGQQVQQAGLDVRVLALGRIVGTGHLYRDSKTLPGYEPLHPNKDGSWVLMPGNAYAVECMEQCQLPIGYEGKLIHRSTLNRSGVLLTGSVYDPGYKGIIAGTLYVFNMFVLEYGARIGQFQIQTCEEGQKYDGDYQNQQSHAISAEEVNNDES